MLAFKDTTFFSFFHVFHYSGKYFVIGWPLFVNKSVLFLSQGSQNSRIRHKKAKETLSSTPEKGCVPWHGEMSCSIYCPNCGTCYYSSSDWVKKSNEYYEERKKHSSWMLPHSKESNSSRNTMDEHWCCQTPKKDLIPHFTEKIQSPLHVHAFIFALLLLETATTVVSQGVSWSAFSIL